MIRLHQAQLAAGLGQIQDPDPFIQCDLMDGRDAFLTIAREKHYEFSSLRRAKFSTMALLYELHNQGKDNFVYTCNTCKAHVETRYHCRVCDVSIGRYLHTFNTTTSNMVLQITCRMSQILKCIKTDFKLKYLVVWIGNCRNHTDHMQTMG